MATRRPLIVNAAANQIQELTDSDTLSTANITATTSFVGPGTIPIGGIIMWFGSIASIPTGWALCDGSGGTPDLRSRFIVGATSDASTGVTFNANTGAVSGAYAPGNTGGSVAHQLTVAEMPSHTHQVTVPASGKFDVQGNDLDVPTNGNGTYTTTSAGSDDYHENRPPYYALAFIIRII